MIIMSNENEKLDVTAMNDGVGKGFEFDADDAYTWGSRGFKLLSDINRLGVKYYNKILYRDVDDYVQDKIDFEKSQEKAPFKFEIDYLKYDVQIMNSGESKDDGDIYDELLQMKDELGDKEFSNEVYKLIQNEIGDDSDTFTFDDVKNLDNISNIIYQERNDSGGNTSIGNKEILTYAMNGTGLTFQITKEQHDLSTEMMGIQGLGADPEFRFGEGAEGYYKNKLKDRFQIDNEMIYSENNYNTLNRRVGVEERLDQNNFSFQTFVEHLRADFADGKVDSSDIVFKMHTLPKVYEVNANEIRSENQRKMESENGVFERKSYLQEYVVKQTDESFTNLMDSIERARIGGLQNEKGSVITDGRDVIHGSLMYIENSLQNVEGFQMEGNKDVDVTKGLTYSEMKDSDLIVQGENITKLLEEPEITQDMNVFDKLKTKSSMFKASEIEASRDRRNAREQIDLEFETKQNRENYKRLNERYASKDWSSSKESTRIENDKDLSDDLAL